MISTAILFILGISNFVLCGCVNFTERIVPHKLFTPLLTGMLATGVFLSVILVVLVYKYMQVRAKLSMLNW